MTGILVHHDDRIIELIFTMTPLCWPSIQQSGLVGDMQVVGGDRGA
jgi:hypothetical protein